MKLRKKTKILIAMPVLLVLLYLGFNLRVGQTFVIKTAVPAEDFVVLCTKRTRKLIGHNSTHTSKITKVIVTESGVEQSCGYFVGGEPGVLRVMHPTLVGDGKSHYVKNGVMYRVFNKTKLDLLDEQKEKFEAGYWDKLPVPGWDKDKTPAQRYARSIGGCGLGGDYLDYYSQVKKPNKDYFMKKYNDFLFECNKMAYEEKFVNDPSLKGEVLGADKMMKLIWDDEQWRGYEK